MKKFLIFLSLFVFAFTLTASAKAVISPAIDVIANENSMVKAGVLTNGELLFDVYDFDECLGTNVNYITVVSLPTSSTGRLMIDNLYVLENQVIYRDDFSLLKFVSTGDLSQEVFFSFKPNDNEYVIECELKGLESVNLSPVATNGATVSTWTMEDVTHYGSLDGYDPEGDSLRYEIVSYPSKGLLYLDSTSTGDFRYSPYIEASGDDSFSYRVRDSYGNYSETCTVKMKIQKTATKLVFSDTDERDYKAAAVMKQFDLMDITTNVDGTLTFNPEQSITREEFVVLVMKAMGAKNVPTLEKTRFADDKEISAEYKGYIESAFSLGIVSGTIKSDGVHFSPKATVSKADAAIIINNIIGAKVESALTVFLDSEEIPDNAREAITSLTALGIFEKSEGKISPNAPLTRAQTAKILMSLLEYRGKVGK